MGTKDQAYKLAVRYSRLSRLYKRQTKGMAAATLPCTYMVVNGTSDNHLGHWLRGRRVISVGDSPLTNHYYLGDKNGLLGLEDVCEHCWKAYGILRERLVTRRKLGNVKGLLTRFVKEEDCE